MLSALSLALSLQFFAQPSVSLQENRVPEYIPRFAFDVLNQRKIGRRIIHLEDVIGPDAKTVSGMSPAKSVLVIAIGFDCSDCSRYWETLKKAQAIARKGGGRVIGVMWSEESRKSEIRQSDLVVEQSAIVVWDAFRLARTSLGLMRRGSAIILRADGTVDGKYALVQGDTQKILSDFSKVLKEGG